MIDCVYVCLFDLLEEEIDDYVEWESEGIEYESSGPGVKFLLAHVRHLDVDGVVRVNEWKQQGW